MRPETGGGARLTMAGPDGDLLLNTVLALADREPDRLCREIALLVSSRLEQVPIGSPEAGAARRELELTLGAGGAYAFYPAARGHSAGPELHLLAEYGAWAGLVQVGGQSGIAAAGADFQVRTRPLSLQLGLGGLFERGPWACGLLLGFDLRLLFVESEGRLVRSDAGPYLDWGLAWRALARWRRGRFAAGLQLGSSHLLRRERFFIDGEEIRASSATELQVGPWVGWQL